MEVQFEFEYLGQLFQYVHEFDINYVCNVRVVGTSEESVAIIKDEDNYNRVFFYGREIWKQRRIKDVECELARKESCTGDIVIGGQG